jgi:hypothetical protein
LGKDAGLLLMLLLLVLVLWIRRLKGVRLEDIVALLENID